MCCAGVETITLSFIMVINIMQQIIQGINLLHSLRKQRISHAQGKQGIICALETN
jgi:hypothetical protein